MVAHPLHGGVSNALVGFRFAAARELVEETGVSTTDLDFTTVVEFEFQRPTRREYGAVYRTALQVKLRLVESDEVSDFRWWDPCSSSIGRRVVEGLVSVGR
jgi:8-oxo-dGTP pyrophosphatase MutT (NUDIX family)